MKLDLNAESTTNWRILQTAIEYLDDCHAKGKKINPKKKEGKQIGQSIKEIFFSSKLKVS